MAADEINTFVSVWLTSIASACYCYALSTVTHGGVVRLLLVLPVICLFTALPFFLTSQHLGGTILFFLTWLGNFKLLLFAAAAGPLSGTLSLPQFICTALLPIKAKRDFDLDPLKKAGFRASPCAQVNGSNLGGSRSPRILNVERYAPFGVKAVAFACIIGSYNYKSRLPRYVLLGLHCCHIYLVLEMILAVGSALARATIGFELAPQSNEPYLATSLQDFWGRRWNLMVSDILRQTIYNPIRSITSPQIGEKWAAIIGVLLSFLVSGLMHEFCFYYSSRVSPTWEVTCFFLLHGVCTAIEVMIKRKVSNKWRLHRAISGPLTVGFVVVTSAWLFFPQLLRDGALEKAFDEYPAMVSFKKRNAIHWL